MENCIFCKIIKKEIPSIIVYEDESFLAFLDIQPVSEGHLLLIPKKHVIWMQDAEDELISEIFKLSKKLMLALKKGLNCDYVQVAVSGTDVPHFHVHLIPRLLDDRLPQFLTREFEEKNGQEIVQKIIQAL